VDVNAALARANRAKARLRLRMIEAAATRYYMDHEYYPETLDALADGYLHEAPVDPWGEEYVYDSTGGTRNPYRILSKGEDRVEGTDDDITSED
jgi:hypothetical protein